MSRYSMIVVFACAVSIAGGYPLKERGRQGIGLAARRQIMMEQMMNWMPDNSPRKMIMSVLPRLQEQNEQILALLKDQCAKALSFRVSPKERMTMARSSAP